jgi:hypothetical protein
VIGVVERDHDRHVGAADGDAVIRMERDARRRRTHDRVDVGPAASRTASIGRNGHNAQHDAATNTQRVEDLLIRGNV